MSEALQAAIQANDAAATAAAIKSVKNLSSKFAGAASPVAYACNLGADKALAALLDAKAPAKGKSTYWQEHPFAIAAAKEHLAALEVLAERVEVPNDVLDSVLTVAAAKNREPIIRLIVERLKRPVTDKLVSMALLDNPSDALLEFLLAHGGSVNAREDLGFRPLHRAAKNADERKIRFILTHGGDVNAHDDMGRTPLMYLAMEQVEMHQGNLNRAILRERRANDPKMLAMLQPLDPMLALRVLLESGADATLTDNYGNDAIAYCELGFALKKQASDQVFTDALRKAGAPGGGATGKLHTVLVMDDLAGMQAAIAEGADVNRNLPVRDVPTPLMWVRSSKAMTILLAAKADPNKTAPHGTPLIMAARSGELDQVKQLVAAGADLEVPESADPNNPNLVNAYVAADHAGRSDVKAYLKSLGSGMPKPKVFKPIEPGVGMWEDFSEIVVKADAVTVVTALAKMIGGTVDAKAYDKTIKIGKRAYVVVQAKGLPWSNVLQVAPQRKRFEDAKKMQAFCKELTNASGAPVLWAQYGDTSDAAAVDWFQPDGLHWEAEDLDRKTLKSIVQSMGEKSPAWMKAMLTSKKEYKSESTEWLERMATEEKFVLATMDLQADGQSVDVGFAGYPAAAFDAVALVSN